MDWIDTQYYGNTVGNWLLASGIIVGSFALARILNWTFANVLKKIAARTRTQIDGILVDQCKGPIALAPAILGSSYALNVQLTTPDYFGEFIRHAFHFALIMNLAWLLTRIVHALVEHFVVPFAKETESDLDDQLVPVLRRGLTFIIWTIGGVLAFDNAGYDVAAALAGLGIGGLALAMAGRDTVANVFGGLMVFMDQPFKLSDRVRISGFDGTVVDIGIRSTQIRTLEGRIVTIPNAKFTENPVENVSREPGRKVELTVRLAHRSTAEQVEEAMKILHGIASDDEKIDAEPQVGLSSFSDFSLDLTLIYRIAKGSDILGTQSEVNMQILRKLSERDIKIAFREFIGN